MSFGNKRQRMIAGLVFFALVLIAICIGGILNGEEALLTDFTRKNLAPCLRYPFGTDWLGRDMLSRTLKGLSTSILLGVLSAAVSAVIALILGVVSATMGKTADSVISFIIDLMMGIPHILLLILISVAFGKGFQGVAFGIALTHWPSLARVIRGEVLQLKESPYILIAEKMGKGKLYIAAKHMFPHLLSQFSVGLILLFPHAIMHESAVTFLGFGLSSEQPAVGIILSESMKYLVTGQWWLAVLPGIMLVIVVMSFYAVGESARKLADPASAHK